MNHVKQGVLSKDALEKLKRMEKSIQTGARRTDSDLDHALKRVT